MHDRHLDPLSYVTLAVAGSLDVIAHGMITAISAVAALVTVICQVYRLKMDRDNSEAARRKFRLQCFREWEAQRDRK